MMIKKLFLCLLTVIPIKAYSASPWEGKWEVGRYHTRSFEDFMQNLEYLEHALNGHVHEACQKLRRWNGFCQGVEVMLRTKDFKYYATETKLENPTNGDQEVRMTSLRLLKALYRPNLIYRSTGVTLKNLSYGEVQQSLFEEIKPHDDKLSHLVDELEAKFGKGIVKTGV